MKFRILFFVCIIIFPVSLLAQISGSSTPKDISAKRGSRASKAKISTRITLGGNYQTGNTEKAAVSGSAYLASVDSIKEFSANAKYTYGENNKKLNQKEYMAGIQYDYHPLSRFSPFVRVEFYKNEFKKINGRYSGLLGAKYRYLVKDDVMDYSISAALVYDLENYTNNASLPDRERLRLSIRPKFKQQLMDNIHLLAEIYYKPNLAEFDDYIVYATFNLNFRMNKYVFLRASYEYDYDSKPATATVKKTDTLLLASLGVEW